MIKYSNMPSAMNSILVRRKMSEIWHNPDASGSLGGDIQRELISGDAPNSIKVNTGYSNRILAETETLSLLPTISPLQLGHCVVFSRVPQRSLSTLLLCNKNITSEINSICDKYKSVFGEAIIFEHGMSSHGDTHACGVTQAHFHLFPAINIDVLSLVNAVSKEMKNNHRISLWPNAEYANKEYISLVYPGNNAYSWTQNNITSQVIRRHIANQLRLNEWDWKQMFGWQDMIATMAKWKHAAGIL